MLDPAGILSGSLLRNAKIHKKAGKQSVTLVNRLGDLMSLSVSAIKPSLSIKIYPFSRRFFMATLTLGLEKESAVAMSIERTFPFAFPSIRMVSR